MANGIPWSADDDRILLAALRNGMTEGQIAQFIIGRSIDAIRARSRFLRGNGAPKAVIVRKLSKALEEQVAFHSKSFPTATLRKSAEHLFGGVA